MAENSRIEWTDHTFNPWIGCQNVSPGCDNCYAEALMDKRFGRVKWGPHGKRQRTSNANWNKPLKWNDEARLRGVRYRVFCASLADIFDNKADPQWRADLFALIARTKSLDWQLLTKRPENMAKMLPEDWGEGYPNVWLGVTAEDQKNANRRIPHLLNTPAAIRFVSYEPALGPVDFSELGVPLVHHHPDNNITTEEGRRAFGALTKAAMERMGSTTLDWIIAGGESGKSARPAHPDWFRAVRDQCVAVGVPFFFKQWGEWASVSEVEGQGNHYTFLDGATVRRVGKGRAGAMLDGREHREFPPAGGGND